MIQVASHRMNMINNDRDDNIRLIIIMMNVIIFKIEVAISKKNYSPKSFFTRQSSNSF